MQRNWKGCGINAKLVRPILFKRFIDGFKVTKGSKLDFEYWVSEFNSLRETMTIDKFNYGDKVDFMALAIFKGDKLALDER